MPDGPASAPPAPAPSAPSDVTGLTFDEAFAELQSTVGVLESGGQPLEETLALYERAVALQRHCERLLAEAELRVSQLVSRSGGGLAVEPVLAEETPEP